MSTPSCLICFESDKHHILFPHLAALRDDRKAARRLADLLTAREKAAGLTHQALAGRLRGRHGVEVTPQAISQWFSGRRLPGYEMLLALAFAFTADARDRDAAEKLARSWVLQATADSRPRRPVYGRSVVAPLVGQ